MVEVFIGEDGLQGRLMVSIHRFAEDHYHVLTTVVGGGVGARRVQAEADGRTIQEALSTAICLLYEPGVKL